MVPAPEPADITPFGRMPLAPPADAAFGALCVLARGCTRPTADAFYAFDAATGRRVWSSGIAGGRWTNGVRPTIYAVRADRVAVYVGGSFTWFAGAPRAAVAALDAKSGSCATGSSACPPDLRQRR
jgi:outer membrane protein assembly factor BamB